MLREQGNAFGSDVVLLRTLEFLLFLKMLKIILIVTKT